MRRAALLFCLAAPAVGQDLDCQTRGYCANDLTCHPDDAVLELRRQPDGTALMGWADDTYRFQAKILAKERLTVYASTGEPGSIQILSVGPAGQATFSISAVFDGQLYTSFQVLTCRPR